MQIIINVMFVVTILVALFFFYKYEKECERTDELEELICEMNGKLKEKTQLVLIGDIVQNYKKDITHRNACTAMRDISDIILSIKEKELTSSLK